MATLRTRIRNGYAQFFDEQRQEWVYTHRRAMENKLGTELPPGSEAHVHHINRDKRDNRYENLTLLKRSVHDRVHREDRDACFRCGRSGHWAQDCYARTDFEGEEIDDDEDDY